MVDGQAEVVPLLWWALLVERELLIFAAFWIVFGLLDELAIDLTWLWLRLTGRANTTRLPAGYGAAELSGKAAVLIPAYQEATVIGATISHMLRVWPQRELRIYVGCYCNDVPTLAAAMEGAGHDPRVRLVVHGVAGPTTKADCLNRLYAALAIDEERTAAPYRSIILHDAEDLAHPAALQAIDTALASHDFVQLPVRPLLQDHSRWIAGHYADEFTESHAKGLVVRDALGASIPAAGVGCGFSREALRALVARQGGDDTEGPFSSESLTEDYELGLAVSRRGKGGTFLRLRDASGAMVATGSYFPTELGASVRQKTRWIHGIAFQGWDRLGWSVRPVELWMALRDRRGPLTALVLGVAYLLLVVDGLLLGASWLGWLVDMPLSPVMRAMLMLGLAGSVWRALMRAALTTREYGLAEGLRAVLRIPIGNIIAIIAGRRAFAAYLRTLNGGNVIWDKTAHEVHPATVLAGVRG